MENKIKSRNKTTNPLYELQRRNEIFDKLTECFEKNSLNEEDKVILFEWACASFGKEDIYLLEKKKLEILKR